MDDTINRCLIYGAYPPKGIYFTVMVEYFTGHPIFGNQLKKGSGLITKPIQSFDEAIETSNNIANSMVEKFGKVDVAEVDPELHDGFHLYVNDIEHQHPLARVAIETHDIRGEVIH